MGVNEITIPVVSNLGDEQGGALYIEYTGGNSKDSYAVRVSGGSPYPVLDLTKAKSKEERAELIGSYFDQMKSGQGKSRIFTTPILRRQPPTQRFQEKHMMRKTVFWERQTLFWIK